MSIKTAFIGVVTSFIPAGRVKELVTFYLSYEGKAYDHLHSSIEEMGDAIMEVLGNVLDSNEWKSFKDFNGKIQVGDVASQLEVTFLIHKYLERHFVEVRDIIEGEYKEKHRIYIPLLTKKEYQEYLLYFEDIMAQVEEVVEDEVNSLMPSWMKDEEPQVQELSDEMMRRIFPEKPEEEYN